MPKVSIITSVYNTEAYLSKCIESVITQTFSDFEFIIINNGSTDRSEEIIRKYLLVDDRIIVINNEENKYLSEARNQGIDKATGKYIYFIDSDDYIDRDTIEKSVQMIESNDYDLLIFGWVMEYSLSKGQVSIPVNPKAACYNTQNEFRKNIMTYLKQSTLTVPWNKLYKKKILDKYFIRFPKTKLEDHHFNMEYIKNINTCCLIPNSFYHYNRLRAGSELSAVYKFNLFQKKKDHYLHTKEIYSFWGLKDFYNLNILYTYFAERIVQCIQEIVENNNISTRCKKKEILQILNDSEVSFVMNNCHDESLMMRILLKPIQKKWANICILESKVIIFYKRVFKNQFVKLRAKTVNGMNK